MLEHVNFPTDIRVGAASLPPFHALGVIFQLVYPTTSLKSVSVYAPTSYHDPTIAPVIPNAQNMIETIQRTKSTALLVVPFFLEEWVTSPHVVQLLSGLEYVVRPYFFFSLSKMNTFPRRLFVVGPSPQRRGTRWLLQASSSRRSMAQPSFPWSRIRSGVPQSRLFGSGYGLDRISVYVGCRRRTGRTSVKSWCVSFGVHAGRC